jgi:hypothetical protein
MRLVAEIVEVWLVDEPLDGDVHRRALLARGDPITHHDRFDALDPQSHGDAQELGHVSCEARRILGQDDLEGRG